MHISHAVVDTRHDLQDEGKGNRHQHTEYPRIHGQFRPDSGVRRHGLHQRIRRVEGSADVVQQIEEQHINRREHRAAGYRRRQAVQRQKGNRGNHGAQNNVRFVFAPFSGFRPIHDPALQRIIHRVHNTSHQKQHGTEHSGPCADAGIISQIQHKHGGHER